jgi:hypothetical protein
LINLFRSKKTGLWNLKGPNLGRGNLRVLYLLWFVIGFTCPANSEIIHLKNGDRISGKVVGIENGGYKIESSLGVLVNLRDSIELIKINQKDHELGTRVFRCRGAWL